MVFNLLSNGTHLEVEGHSSDPGVGVLSALNGTCGQFTSSQMKLLVVLHSCTLESEGHRNFWTQIICNCFGESQHSAGPEGCFKPCPRKVLKVLGLSPGIQ